MSENIKRSTSRVELKERIIERAMQAFKTHGIKCITMDDIAASMGISKRTLYEVFANKEMLLEDCIRKERQETNEYIRTILGQSAHVLEVLLKSSICAASRSFIPLTRVFSKTSRSIPRPTNCSRTTRTATRRRWSTSSRRG